MVKMASSTQPYTYGLERIEVEALDETRSESQDPLYYLYDGLGSVTFMVKPDGNKRDHYRYDEFGKPAPGNSKLSQDGKNVLHNTFGYTGEMWDQESELLYLRARYYEPETGRFLSRDTYEGILQNPLSRHLYAYVGNNPVNYVDPSGLIWLKYNDVDLMSNEVEMTQFLLKELGYDVEMTGHFDENTLVQVNKFKTDQKLGNYGEWEGVVGDQTFIKLMDLYWLKYHAVVVLELINSEKPIVYTDHMNENNPYCSVRLNKPNLKILMDELDLVLLNVENDVAWSGGVGDAASYSSTVMPPQYGFLAQGYVVVSGLTEDWTYGATLDDLKIIKRDLNYYYNHSGVVSVGISFYSPLSPDILIGTRKHSLWSGTSVLHQLIHNTFNVRNYSEYERLQRLGL